MHSLDVRTFSLNSTLRLITDGKCTIVERDGVTSGALCSCLLAIDDLDLENELIIANSDQVIDYDISKCVSHFREQNADAGVITFNSVHPRWSYVLYNDCGEAIRLEKYCNMHAGITFIEKLADLFLPQRKL